MQEAKSSASTDLHEGTVSYPERLVISPAWGRLRREPLAEGQILEGGAVIGTIREGVQEIPIVSPVRGEFIAWVASDGERVQPRKPVAWLRQRAEEQPTAT